MVRTDGGGLRGPGDGVPRAFACWRVMEMLAVGKHVYVDDLVTDAAERSRGYGKAMLDWLKAEATRRGCASSPSISASRCAEPTTPRPSRAIDAPFAAR